MLKSGFISAFLNKQKYNNVIKSKLTANPKGKRATGEYS